jgi:hypothetical protein
VTAAAMSSLELLRIAATATAAATPNSKNVHFLEPDTHLANLKPKYQVASFLEDPHFLKVLTKTNIDEASFLFKIDPKTKKTIAHEAAKTARGLPVLQLIYSNPQLKKLLFSKDKNGDTIIHTAATYGAVPVLKWAFSTQELKPLFFSSSLPHTYANAEIIKQAAEYQETDVFEWMWSEPTLRGPIYGLIQEIVFSESYGKDRFIVAWALTKPELEKIIIEGPSTAASIRPRSLAKK